MSCGRCGLRETNLFLKPAEPGGAEEQRGFRFTQPAHAQFWYHNVLLDSVSELQQQPMILYCTKCTEEYDTAPTAAGGGGSGQSASVAVSGPIKRILDIIVVMKQPSQYLADLAADPEKLAARQAAAAAEGVGSGGGFTATTIEHVLAHRDDEVAVRYGQENIPAYDPGAWSSSSLARSTRLKTFAKAAGAAAASVSDIGMSMTTRESLR